MFNINEKNIYNFFQDNVDRLYVVNELFPKIGCYLQDNGKKNVLNIGIETFNKYDREFFKNDNINFFGLDKNHKQFTPNKWKHIYHIDLTYDLPEKMPTFDVIIDYGVIGWGGVNSDLNQEQIRQYIKNIASLLEEKGLYFLKIDYKYTQNNKMHKIKNEIILNIVLDYFTVTNFYDLSKKKLIQNKDIYYETFSFTKKPS